MGGFYMPRYAPFATQSILIISDIQPYMASHKIENKAFYDKITQIP